MPINYEEADRLLQLSFGKLNRGSARFEFPRAGTLSARLNLILSNTSAGDLELAHSHSSLLATAGVEMWHRSIHSFLWSVALTEKSPLWASVTGYYSSHFVMRAFSHSMGIFKSFTHGKVIQVVAKKGQFVCQTPESKLGEHAFYWKTVCEHPDFKRNRLFRENHERNPRSDSAHRTFANYTDHLNAFPPLASIDLEQLARNVEKISRIWSDSIPEPSKENFPDLSTVQILAFRRILAFHDFLDAKVQDNRFWRAHRRPTWCRDTMVFQAEDTGLEQPLVA